MESITSVATKLAFAYNDPKFSDVLLHFTAPKPLTISELTSTRETLQINRVKTLKTKFELKPDIGFESENSGDSGGPKSEQEAEMRPSDKIEHNSLWVSKAILASESGTAVQYLFFRCSKTEISSSIFCCVMLTRVFLEYFRMLFSNGMKETGKKEIYIELSDEKQEYFREVIYFLYHKNFSGRERSYTFTDHIHLLLLADQYAVMAVVNKCKKLIEENVRLFSGCFQYLKLIDSYERLNDFPQIISECHHSLIVYFKEFEDIFAFKNVHEDFLSLNATALKILLDSNVLKVTSENSIFQGLVLWLNEDKSRKSYLPELITKLRFAQMDVNFITDVVLQNADVKELDEFLELVQVALMFHSFTEKRKRISKDHYFGPKYEKMFITRDIINKKRETRFEWEVTNVSEVETEMSESFYLNGYYLCLVLKKKRRREHLELYLYTDEHQTPLPDKYFVAVKYRFWVKDVRSVEWHPTTDRWYENVFTDFSGYGTSRFLSCEDIANGNCSYVSDNDSVSIRVDVKMGD